MASVIITIPTVEFSLGSTSIRIADCEHLVLYRVVAAVTIIKGNRQAFVGELNDHDDHVIFNIVSNAKDKIYAESIASFDEV